MKIISCLRLLSLTCIFSLSAAVADKKDRTSWSWETGPRPSATMRPTRCYKVVKERYYKTDFWGRKGHFLLVRLICEYANGQVYERAYCLHPDQPTPYESNSGPTAPLIPKPKATWHYSRKHYHQAWDARNTGPHGRVLKYWVKPLDEHDKQLLGDIE